VSPASLLDISASTFQISLLDESGTIRNQTDTHNRSEIGGVQGSPCAPIPQGKRIKDNVPKKSDERRAVGILNAVFPGFYSDDPHTC
jgi:hypothetical protein